MVSVGNTIVSEKVPLACMAIWFYIANLVSWCSKKQALVASSSTKAKYRSMTNTVAEVTWIQSLPTELAIPFATPKLYCDNLSAISLAHNPVLYARTKHIELDIHFVREKVIAKALSVHHVPSSNQLADSLTKPLSSSQFTPLRTKLKVVPVQQPPWAWGGLLEYRSLSNVIMYLLHHNRMYWVSTNSVMMVSLVQLVMLVQLPK